VATDDKKYPVDMIKQLESEMSDLKERPNRRQSVNISSFHQVLRR
jgi:hypothetical protein